MSKYEAVGTNLLRIPVDPPLHGLRLRLSPLPRSGDFVPHQWPSFPLSADPTEVGWLRIDLGACGLEDGSYEYEFFRGDFTVADPFAEEITRFSGYRGVLHWRNGQRVRPAFDWSGELSAAHPLPHNHQLVIYELPVRWVESDGNILHRQVGLGTFEKLLFQYLDSLTDLGVNAIELLPVQDSADTLNWGYGTRFFFSPDFDMGEPFDLKLFIKRCHQRGIRVLLDVVMNHAKQCPLESLAFERYFLHNGMEEPIQGAGGRPDWGGKTLRYRRKFGDTYPARELMFQMAEFWTEQFHVDGYRIDEFQGIDNWEFISDFRARSRQKQQELFPGRPFVVIAEDSWNRAEATRGENPVVDAIWDFGTKGWFRDLARQGYLETESLRELLSLTRFGDMSDRVVYFTSHDEDRMTHVLRELPSDEARFRVILGLFALLLTAVGVPMFLAGEELADLNDLDHGNDDVKMTDPVDFGRAQEPRRAALRAQVTELIRLRTSHPALQRNEIRFFGFDGDSGFWTSDSRAGVFVYCRNGGRALGEGGQVVVAANFTSASVHFDLRWPWAGTGEEVIPWTGQPRLTVSGGKAQVELRAQQVRVFRL